MNAEQLIEVLQALPDKKKTILCQVVDQSGHAFNCHFEFKDVPDSWMVQLKVSHKELKDLYDIPTLAEEDAKKPQQLMQLAMLVKRMNVISGGGIQSNFSFVSDLVTASAQLAYGRTTMTIQQPADGPVSVRLNGMLVETYNVERDKLAEFLTKKLIGG